MTLWDEVGAAPLTYPPRPGRDAARLVATMRRAVGVIESRINVLRETLDGAREAFLALHGRVDVIEKTAVALTMVATVADLPASASRREWFRVQTGTVAERTAIYVGNGPNLPLAKLTPSAL